MKTLRWFQAFLLLASAALGCGREPLGGVAPEEALKRLLDGNARYVTAKATHPDQTAERRTAVAVAQSPFAVVVGCSDSRVPPEVIFDQGLGDLFVVRSAGHVMDDASLGSLEYAVEHLGAHLILVLGHERCGAVDAAVKGLKAEGHIAAIAKAIQPAVEAARGKPGDWLDNAVRANVGLVTQSLNNSKPLLHESVEAGKLKVVGARYDLDTGAVELVTP